MSLLGLLRFWWRPTTRRALDLTLDVTDYLDDTDLLSAINIMERISRARFARKQGDVHAND